MKSHAQPVLGPNEIHVWTVNLDVPVAADGSEREEEMLTAAERAQAQQLAAEADITRFLRRRAALRMILGGYLGSRARDIVFAVNAYGKPSVLAPKTGAALAFNASHAGSLAVIAVGRSLRIGVDVEYVRPDIEDEGVAARFFSAGERAALAALEERDRLAGFFNAWTRKEAVVKALGKGLSIPFDSFEVSLRPGEPPEILRWNAAAGAAKSWRIHHLEPLEGYVGAVAVDSATASCQCLKWEG
jgi:4'-phosphopantetheinyl transferase